MPDNVQKTPVSDTLNEFARLKAADAIQQTGRSLPATVVSAKGSIVTVKFEITNSVFTLPNVTIPLFGPEYIRYPIQPGDKGFVVAADAYLGGMSGLGGGTADLSQLANLAALVFFPIGNTSFFAVDPQAVVIYGPNGVSIRDATDANDVTVNKQVITLTSPNSITSTVGTSKVTMTPTAITLSSSGHSIIINALGVIIDGKLFLTHEHTGVQGGSGVTGPVL